MIKAVEFVYSSVIVYTSILKAEKKKRPMGPHTKIEEERKAKIIANT